MAIATSCMRRHLAAHLLALVMPDPVGLALVVDFLDANPAPAQAEPKSGGGDGDGGQEPYEEYEVEILKPYGLKFAKGRDGGTYIEAIFPGSSAEQTGKFTVGDKVIATRSVRSDDPLTTANPQQFQNDRQIKISSVLLTDGKFTAPSLERKSGRRQGKWDGAAELSDKEVIRAERNTGNVSTKLREIQMQNYQKKMEQKIQREDDLRMGLKLYKSVIHTIQAGLSALEEAMKAGYEDFKRIRTDPDLANLRNSEEFATLLNKYDESFINESAINAIKSIFGFGKK
uniref:Uncharacterized protein n=1 Tax=Aegilops tauschii TaxID=37682 RepID=N1QPA0_AEGTA